MLEHISVDLDNILSCLWLVAACVDLLYNELTTNVFCERHH